MKDMALKWIDKAYANLTLAGRIVLDDYDNSCYNSQQAGEKFIKAIFCELDLDIPQTNSAKQLLQTLDKEFVDVPEEIMIRANEITTFAKLSSYPGYDCTLEQAKSALESAKEISKFSLNWFGFKDMVVSKDVSGVKSIDFFD